MIEKIKYCLNWLYNSRQIRISCLAVLTAATIAVVTLLGNSIYTVNIFDGTKTYTIRTLNNSVSNVISGLNLESNYSIKRTSVSGRTTSVEISYTYPVYVTCKDNTIEIEFKEGTVKDALEAAGFTPDQYDLVYPSLETKINDTVYIDYTNIDYINGTYTEKIPFTTETVYSASYEKGVTKTLQKGSEGERQVTYTEKLVNGVSAEKTVTASTVITNAVNQKNVVGTKVAAKNTSSAVKSISVLSPSTAIELDANGNPVSYKSKMVCRATAYTYTGNKCSTGVSPKPGYIAVNPKVIPYGTKLYIKSADGSIIYGYAVAADTGGFIKKHPTGIDLFMTSESACESFGVRNMEVYILE